MKKTALLLVASALFLTVTFPLSAQIGCVNSPENPTVILALVGSAGAALGAVRNRMRARNKK